MPCNRVHDFSHQLLTGKTIHNFWCLQNAVHGCPHPKPEPEHVLPKKSSLPEGSKRCKKCHLITTIKEKEVDNGNIGDPKTDG